MDRNLVNEIKRNVGRTADIAPFEQNRQILVPSHKVHPFLPITAPDYSYTMDLVELRSLLRAKYENDGEDNPERNTIITKALDDRVNKGFKYLLTFIDTTSRKVWMYPLKTKEQHTVYNAFKTFLKDVKGRIARLLSDNDTAFNRIKHNNDHFSYCVVTAKYHNHTVLSRIDRFVKTFRELLYRVLKNHRREGRYSWYYYYPFIREAYNNAKHRSLWLKGRGDRFYYTPNEVWYSPRLRSRIRLRRYLEGEKNYSKVYRDLQNAPYVRVRLHKGFGKGGENYFSDEIFEKGEKRGNAWHVNGKWYTYRNLWPVFNRNYNEPEVRSNREKRNKYRLDKEICRFLDENASDEEEDDDAVPIDNGLEPFLQGGPGIRKAKEGKKLKASFDKMYDRKSVMKRIRAIEDEDEADEALEEFDEIQEIEDEEERRERMQAFLEKLPKLAGSLSCCKKNRKNVSHRGKIKYKGAGKITFKRKHFPMFNY